MQIRVVTLENCSAKTSSFCWSGVLISSDCLGSRAEAENGCSRAWGLLDVQGGGGGRLLQGLGLVEVEGGGGGGGGLLEVEGGGGGGGGLLEVQGEGLSMPRSAVVCSRSAQLCHLQGHASTSPPSHAIINIIDFDSLGICMLKQIPASFHTSLAQP